MPIARTTLASSSFGFPSSKEWARCSSCVLFAAVFLSCWAVLLKFGLMTTPLCQPCCCSFGWPSRRSAYLQVREEFNRDIQEVYDLRCVETCAPRRGAGGGGSFCFGTWETGKIKVKLIVHQHRTGIHWVCRRERRANPSKITGCLLTYLVHPSTTTARKRRRRAKEMPCNK